MTIPAQPAPAARIPTAHQRRIALISTGGTIEKTYDPFSGVLANHVSVLDIMLASLQLEGVTLTRVALMNKDSLDMTPEDHAHIARTAHHEAMQHDGVVIVHGTDRLEHTGARILKDGMPAAPVVLTGAMHPYALRATDAVQNLTEALLAVQLVPPGVYAAFHNRVLPFPGATKDRTRGTFCHVDDRA